MQRRPLPLALLLAFLLMLLAPLKAQEQELLDDQAGLYPIRAYLTAPAVVGNAHLVVVMGRPVGVEVSSELPEARISASPTPPPTVALILDQPDLPDSKPTDLKLTATAANRFEGDLPLTRDGTWRIQYVVATPNGEFRLLSRLRLGAQSPPPQVVSSRAAAQKVGAPAKGANLPPQIHCQPNPARVGSNRLRIELPEETTGPVMVGTDMPGMPSGIPPREAVLQDDGSFEAVVDLPVAGHWQVSLELNGRVLAPFDLTVVESQTGGLLRPAGLLLLIALAPGGVWWCLRRRRPVLTSTAVGLTLLLSAVVASRVIESHWSGDMSLPGTTSSTSLMVALPVLEARVQKLPLVVSRDYPGTVAASEETLVLSPRTGVLTEIVAAGTPVRAGSLLARIDREGEVRAGSAGVVAHGLLLVGAEVAQGTPLLSLGDTREVVARASAPLGDRGLLQAGLEVEVFDSESRFAKGKLTRLSAVSQGDSFEIEALVDNTRPTVLGHGGSPASPGPDSSLGTFSIGQSVTVRCILERLSSALSVPKEAVRETSEGDRTVFIIERVAGQRVARRQMVRLGAATKTHWQVLGGLSEGQTIVARAESSLQDGDVVVPDAAGEGAYRALVLPRDDSSQGSDSH